MPRVRAFRHIDTHARQTMIAAAEAHHATGAPIGVHHELGTAALDEAEHWMICAHLSHDGRLRVLV